MLVVPDIGDLPLNPNPESSGPSPQAPNDEDDDDDDDDGDAELVTCHVIVPLYIPPQRDQHLVLTGSTKKLGK